MGTRIDFNVIKLTQKFEERERFKTSAHGTYKSLEQKTKYNVYIFEKGRGGGVGGWGGRL